ncbi:hypothetical protein D6851_02415 [Altericroceibacterium spongiae]|uniref:Uncharacterized protein n=2 Tax=Altericroceibacterium spongiae TaxID=2320269 RepID=A0A420ERN6_9SPHN|nr:hypothetical protein D6851_02415 [Altericroceibacterium spongiae]
MAGQRPKSGTEEIGMKTFSKADLERNGQQISGENPQAEDLGKCVGCCAPLLAGHVVTVWDDETAHYDCDNPYSLKRNPMADGIDESPPPVVILGSPARYVDLGKVIACLGTQSSQSEDTEALQAENERLRDAVANPIVAEIIQEVAKATTKFPTWPTRIIDAGNVVSEEAGELAKACLQVTYEKHKETMEGVHTEAVQTAAMCIRFLMSMEVYDTTPGPQHSQRRDHDNAALEGNG